ncbi:MAG TPA: dUTP diphosphatase [Bacteroidales bacterium]|nr:dUTP diphosphatase [Bacteroidales bacterium]
MKIRIVNKSGHRLPAYETTHSAGMDLRACINEQVKIGPMERKLVGTGLYIEVPVGFEAQIRPRSGMAIKHGITVLNSPGTIDADYRGEIGIILVNLSDVEFVINNGDRIAQMIFASHEKAEFIEVEELKASGRGDGGFGHSGRK